MVKLREALRAARKAAGLSISKAANSAGYKSKSGWAMVENGTNTPSLSQMVRMADVVGVKVWEAFPETKDLAAVLDGRKPA